VSPRILLIESVYIWDLKILWLILSAEGYKHLRTYYSNTLMGNRVTYPIKLNTSRLRLPWLYSKYVFSFKYLRTLFKNINEASSTIIKTIKTKSVENKNQVISLIFQ